MQKPASQSEHGALGSSATPVPKIRCFPQCTAKPGSKPASTEETSAGSGSLTEVAETISFGSCCGRKRGPPTKATADADSARTAAGFESPLSPAGDEGFGFLLQSAASSVKFPPSDVGFLFGNSLKPVGDEFALQDMGRGHTSRRSPASSCDNDALSPFLPSDSLADEDAEFRSPAPSLTPARPSTAARAVTRTGESPWTALAGAKSAPVPPRGALPLLRLPQETTFSTPAQNACLSRGCGWSPSDWGGRAGEAFFYTARDGTSEGVFHVAHGTGTTEGGLLTGRGETGFYTARTDGVFHSARGGGLTKGVFHSARGGVTEAGACGVACPAERIFAAGTGVATSPRERVHAVGTGCNASPLRRSCSVNLASAFASAASPGAESSGFMTARSGAATPRTWRETQTFSAVRDWVRKEPSQVCGADLDDVIGDELDTIPPLLHTVMSHSVSPARSTAVSFISSEKEGKL